MIIVFQVVSTSDVQLYWHKSEGKKINFNDIPFSVNEMKVLDCQFGENIIKKSLNRERKCGYKAHKKWDVWHTLR